MAREIRRTTAFKRDYQRETRGRHTKALEQLLREVLALLVEGSPLPAARRDHRLAGEWSGFRDCHLRPDLVLIYRLSDSAVDLVRLGSHSELFE